MNKLNHQLLEISKVSEIILTGRQFLFVAGDAKALSRLPRGPWIGGTIPYFMDIEGGICDRQRIFVHALPEWVSPKQKVEFLNLDTLPGIYERIPRNGFGMAILPGFSEVHREFAVKAPGFKEFGAASLIGWVSGFHLDDVGKVPPQVFNGQTGELATDKGIAAYIELPQEYYAEIGIVNLFNQGDGPSIQFQKEGFAAETAMVDGQLVQFADWCREKKMNVQLPLVADYAGAMINVSFQAIQDNQVDFYAPVFPGVEYRQAKPVGDYPEEFARHAPDVPVTFACNCILNYLYAGLEGRKTAVQGPATFGEIAYQLLNQTLTYLTFSKLQP